MWFEWLLSISADKNRWFALVSRMTQRSVTGEEEAAIGRLLEQIIVLSVGREIASYLRVVSAATKRVLILIMRTWKVPDTKRNINYNYNL